MHALTIDNLQLDIRQRVFNNQYQSTFRYFP